MEKNKIRITVKNCGNQRSTDEKNLDMMTVKTVVESAVEHIMSHTVGSLLSLLPK